MHLVCQTIRHNAANGYCGSLGNFPKECPSTDLVWQVIDDAQLWILLQQILQGPRDYKNSGYNQEQSYHIAQPELSEC